MLKLGVIAFIIAASISISATAQEQAIPTYDEVNIRYYKNLEIRKIEDLTKDQDIYLLAPNNFKVEYVEGSNCELLFSKDGKSFTDSTLCEK